MSISKSAKQFPIGSTIRNAAGVQATVKEHGCTYACINNAGVMLWLNEFDFPWESHNVTLVTSDSPTRISSFTIGYDSRKGTNAVAKKAIQILLDLSNLAIESWKFDHGCCGIVIETSQDIDQDTLAAFLKQTDTSVYHIEYIAEALTIDEANYCMHLRTPVAERQRILEKAKAYCKANPLACGEHEAVINTLESISNGNIIKGTDGTLKCTASRLNLDEAEIWLDLHLAREPSIKPNSAQRRQAIRELADNPHCRGRVMKELREHASTL